MSVSVKIKNYTKKEKLNFITEFKRKVSLSQYEILPTAKNEKTKRLYRLNDTIMKEMLMSLVEDDFMYKLPDNNYEQYGPGLLQVYKKEFKLITFNGVEENVMLYIKFKETNKNLIPVISFHEDGIREEDRE
ncbi:MAG: hypothetical protein K2K15_04175 [Anaeroplasmataceae bacterium]|nr:hypothetical protein [Anaeroplasmataceae bacterium]